MCGIVGYIGPLSTPSILLNQLKRLEYRGYDSAGIAIIKDGTLAVAKQKGKVAGLEEHLPADFAGATVGIGHTRWATHGEPSDTNAHPHAASDDSFALVHNGIIENYASLKSELGKEGFSFVSQTDTEVLVHLIESVWHKAKTSLAEAVRLALNEVDGAYAIAVVSRSSPDELIVAKKGSPLVVGVAADAFFVASDAAPIIEYTRDVVYLDDGEMAILPRGGTMQLIKIADSTEKDPYLQHLELSLDQIEKGEYEHFMLKEIHEQSRSLEDTMRGRLRINEGIVKLGGIEQYEQRILRARRLIITACGTSWHAGMIAKYLIEQMARIPVEVEFASEFRYRNPILDESDVVLAISQSGETADTLAAIELAHERGALTLGICNVAGSSIARATDAGIYTHAGPEISVASTKAFTSQVTALTLLALRLTQLKGTLSEDRLHALYAELATIPEKITKTLDCEEQMRDIAAQLEAAHDVIFLGRGVSYPVALEGALKLKEISYVHAEGYAAGEMKHGPIALIDDKVPTIMIAPNGAHFDKLMSNMHEIKAREGKLLAIVNSDDTEAAKTTDWVVTVPETEEWFSPLLTSIPLQLLAYHVTLAKGLPVDQPRNLAKSVTVE